MGTAMTVAEAGRIGGKKHQASLTPEERSERARAAAKKRWGDSEQRARQSARLKRTRRKLGRKRMIEIASEGGTASAKSRQSI